MFLLKINLIEKLKEIFDRHADVEAILHSGSFMSFDQFQQGVLDYEASKWFQHKGQKLSKNQVRIILEYGINKGYKTTAELSDDEVDEVLYKSKK